MRIAFAAEESKLSDQMADLLRGQGHELASVGKGAGALEALKSSRPQLLVVAEPFLGNGLVGFLRRLREDAVLRPLPVLCVGPSGAEQGVECLDAGADDFMSRPFNAQIFLARVRSLLRRQVWTGQMDEDSVTVLQNGPIAIKLLQRQALVDGDPLLLTRLEFDLLSFLVRNVERVHKREEILQAVWNYPGNVETRTLDKHVEMLRRKLGRLGDAIETVHGVGYRFANLNSPAKRSSPPENGRKLR